MSAENMVHKMENVKLLNNHGSVTSQESIEMEEYSDEEDEVFVRGNIKNFCLSEPLVKMICIYNRNASQMQNNITMFLFYFRQWRKSKRYRVFKKWSK